MTSREFYSAIDQVVRAQLEDQDFCRLKATSSTWARPLGDKYVLLQIEKGVKKPYIKPVGGTFNVWLHLADAPTVREANSDTGISFLRYLADSDLLKMKQIRQRVLKKILSQAEFESEFDKELLEMTRPVMELSFNHDFNRKQPWPLEYLDAEDVKDWAEFIVSKIEQSVAGIGKDGCAALSIK